MNRDGLALLLQAIQEDDYDPACERIDVAIKALWLLYLRGKWQLLAELGLNRRAIEPYFRDFDLTHINVERGRLRREEQVVKLLKSMPEPVRFGVLAAAMEAVRRYMIDKKVERRDYWNRQERPA